MPIDPTSAPATLRAPMKITRALISVSDKTGLVPFAKELAALGVEVRDTPEGQETTVAR